MENKKDMHKKNIIEHKSFNFEIKSIDDIEDELFVGSFKGLGSTFDNMDLGRDIIKPGAFKPALKKIKKTGRMPKALMQHNPYEDQGAIFTAIKEVPDGLFVEGKFINTTRGKNLRIEVKTGAISDFSIGFRVQDFEIDGKNNLRIIKLISELPEISFVAFPMNQDANITEAKNMNINERDFEKSLRDAGFSHKDSKIIISKGFRAINFRDEKTDATEILEMKEKLQSLTKLINGGSKK
jgi:HK97 family phage prohead protease